MGKPKLLCRIFGHMRTAGWWGDGLYGRVRGGYADGIGRSHYEVRLTCDRCGCDYTAARFHGSQVADREAREKEPGGQPSSDSPTNSSGCALKRRELVTFDWQSGAAYGTWRLTDAGRAELGL